MNEELGLPELKKLLAAAQREIMVLRNQMSNSSVVIPTINSNENEIDGDDRSDTSVEEEDVAQNHQLVIRIAELEDLLEKQRLR